MLAAVVAICALSAVTASSALALPEWKVGGAALSGTETVEAAAETSFDFSSTLTGSAKLLLLCASLKTVGASISGPRTDAVTLIRFSGCVIDEPSVCRIKKPLELKPVVTELFDEDTTEVWDLFKPTTGTEFTSFTVTGCSGEGIYKFAGTFCIKEIEPAIEAVTKLWSAGVPTLTEQACALKFGVNPLTLEGTTEFVLAGKNKGKAWRGAF
jgi:hypothetical protein